MAFGSNNLASSDKHRECFWLTSGLGKLGVSVDRTRTLHGCGRPNDIGTACIWYTGVARQLPSVQSHQPGGKGQQNIEGRKQNIEGRRSRGTWQASTKRLDRRT